MTDTGAPAEGVPAKRMVFKKGARHKKIRDTKTDDGGIGLFEHSKHSYNRLVHEKEHKRKAEEERKKKEEADRLLKEQEEEEEKKRLLEQYRDEDVFTKARPKKDHLKTNSPSPEDATIPTITNDIPAISSPNPKKRKSDSFDEDDIDTFDVNKFDFTSNHGTPSKTRTMRGAIPIEDTSLQRGVSNTPATTNRHHTPHLASDEDTAPGLNSPIRATQRGMTAATQQLADPGSPAPRKRTKTPAGNITSLSSDSEDDDDDCHVTGEHLDDDIQFLSTTHKGKDSEEEEKEKDADADMDPFLLRFVEERRQLQASRAKAGAQVPILRIFCASQLPDTKPIITRIRLDQGLDIVRRTWAAKHELRDEDLFLTWRGSRILSSATCDGLGITVGESGDAVMAGHEDDMAGGDGFTEGGHVLLEVWDEALFEDFVKKRDDERRKMRGEFEDEDFFTGDRELSPEEEGNEAPAVRIRVTMKAKEGEGVKISVRPATTVEEMVASFVKQRGLQQEVEGGGTKVFIFMDGDKLEGGMTVEEAEIEDRDVLDVLVKR